MANCQFINHQCYLNYPLYYYSVPQYPLSTCYVQPTIYQDIHFENQQIQVISGNRFRQSATQDQRGKSYKHLSKLKKDLINNNLIIGLFNAHSIGSKQRRIQIVEFIKDEKIDLLFITETWLKQEGDESKQADLCPPGYKLKSVPRCTRAGGIAVIYKEQLKVSFTSNFSFQHSSFELLELTLSAPVQIHFYCMYRPPPNKKNGLHDSTFVHELPDFLDHINSLRGKVIILGDLNVHYNQPFNWLTKKVSDQFTAYDFEQGVKEATFSKSENIIDWVLYRESDAIVKKCLVNNMLTSDHVAVVCTLNAIKPPQEPTYRVFRNIKDIDRETFKKDVKDMVQQWDKEVTAEDLDTGLRNLLDKHAPEEKKLIPPGSANKPWFPLVREELSQAKRIQRRAERRWRKTRLTVDRQVFNSATLKVVRIVEKAEQMYYKSKINENINSKEFFHNTDKLLGRKTIRSLPNDINPSQISEKFSTFFQEKVKTLRDTLDMESNDTVDPLHMDQIYTESTLSYFDLVSETEVKKTIMDSKSKSCSLDPIPTSLLKECIDELLSTITKIINNSLQSSNFPEIYKTALVIPLIKKPDLDKNILKNYRPVSNLSFLSKILEKIVMSQLKNYLSTNNLFPIYQSAYRHSHSTETALLRVMNDLLTESDINNDSILALLDLSAAFDTIDHKILIDRLSLSYGITKNVLQWLKSFLVGRTQSVITKENNSQLSTLHWGVPQGSVLGPLLFLLYTKPLSYLTTKYNISYQSFADDTQLYDSSPNDKISNSISSIQNCISQIKIWMNSNKLKLNDEKTEMLYIHSKSKDITPSNITIGNTSIPFSSHARNLGVLFTDNLSLEKHISKVCRSAFIELRNISSIRKYLD